MNNIVQNVSFPFAIKGNDFKELSLKALKIKKWIDENGQELAEFIYRHRNQYNTTGYKDVHLKDIPSTLTKIDIVFKEPLEKIKSFKDDLNRIRTNIIIFINFLQ
ncbi:hypothetical protein M0C40_05095 [Spiroplasma citri]|uniref:Uncharacterized protein n=1 Tax=Spiroplasma citri TaxID=2133 RepID=A0AAX3SVY3_SPICI|nr:hypothetical protein [Spiroplasma citri]WFG95475.1 hypothetical protein M0C40_05095 [Spiroplasma citri]